MTAGTLEATQRWMHEALVHPRRAERELVERMLAASPRVGAVDGLAIYQRGYFLRIARCMREQFPALCHALGEALFDDFVAEYIRAHPPESHTLYDLGRRFADYLDASRPDRDAPEAWVDFMIDLARFERLVFRMFDAPGNEGRPFAAAATPDARLRLQPCFALGAYRFPVAAYYHAVRGGGEAVIPGPEPSFVALVRTDYVTRTIPLSEVHYRFLEAMTVAGSVAAAAQAIAPQLDLPADAILQLWHQSPAGRQRWIDWGFFVDAAG